MKIEMLDIPAEYRALKPEIDAAVSDCLQSGRFIGGAAVETFERSLSKFLQVNHTISCANGTDALQIALMAIGLESGDEVIVPAFTYIAPAEAVVLLGGVPVLVDVDENTFNISPKSVLEAISAKTKAVIVVHLFGQSADLEPLLAQLPENIFLIEDNAQSIGAEANFLNENWRKTGTIGQIGCTSFFPAKNLGAYGDGGALFTNDEVLAKKIRQIANHGQTAKYQHEVIGINSRLDALQAAILSVKIKYLATWTAQRQEIAASYDRALNILEGVTIPQRTTYSTHVFHQYTLRVSSNKRDTFRNFLYENGIASAVYYPKPIHWQVAYAKKVKIVGTLLNSEKLSQTAVSIPIYNLLTQEKINYLLDKICFFEKK